DRTGRHKYGTACDRRSASGYSGRTGRKSCAGRTASGARADTSFGTRKTNGSDGSVAANDHAADRPASGVQGASAGGRSATTPGAGTTGSRATNFSAHGAAAIARIAASDASSG